MKRRLWDGGLSVGGEVSRGSEEGDVLANVGARYEILGIGSQHWRPRIEWNEISLKSKLYMAGVSGIKGAKQGITRSVLLNDCTAVMTRTE